MKLKPAVATPGRSRAAKNFMLVTSKTSVNSRSNLADYLLCVSNIFSVLIIAVLILGLPDFGRCNTVDDGWKAVGIRGGFSVVKKWEDFQQYEVLAIYGFPWEWRTESGWGVATQGNFTAGLLQGGGKSGFFGGLGPSVVFNKNNKGIEFELGVNLYASNRKVYGRQDLGSNVMFGSFVGVGYQFDNGLGIGYQLQHYSNGHIFYGSSTPNPGIDNHLFIVKWQL